MSLWSRIEQRIWTGEVLKDYGPISEGRLGPVRKRVSVLFSDKGGTRHLWIRSAFWAWFSASVSFVELDREAAVKLRGALDDALARSDW